MLIRRFEVRNVTNVQFCSAASNRTQCTLLLYPPREKAFPASASPQDGSYALTCVHYMDHSRLISALIWQFPLPHTPITPILNPHNSQL